MVTKVVVIDDRIDHRERLVKELEEAGCEVLSFDHADPDGEQSAITVFGPEIAVVDSLFATELEGIGIVRRLFKIKPDIKIVICSILDDEPSRQHWFRDKYKDIPGVCAIFGKARFPSAEAILAACSRP